MAIKQINAGTPKAWNYATYNTAQEPQFYSKSIDYINCIPQLIGVATREGLKLYPEYSSLGIGPYFIIRIRFKFRVSIKQQMIKQWRAGIYVNTDMQQIIQDQWITNNNIHGQTDLFLEYKIHETQIIENGGIVFIPAADCSVGIGSRTKDPGQLYHPGTIEGNILETAHSSLQGDFRTAERSSDYCFHIRIVDNSGTIGPKWVSFGPFVSKIIPVKHPGVRDGYYITRTKDADYKCESDNSLVSDYYEKSEDVKCVTICDSFASAISTPSFETSVKEKISLTERQTKLDENEAKLLKAKNDLENITRSSERDSIKHALDMEKLNAEINKLKDDKEKYEAELDYLKSKMSAEKISLWRKFIGDTLKYVPVIITTTIAVYKLFAIAK